MKEPHPTTGANARNAWIRALESMRRLSTAARPTLASVIRDVATGRPDDTAFVTAVRTLTYRQLSEQLDLYASWALSQQLPAGAVVCLLASNSPEYAAIWLGLSSVGVVVALINTGLSGDALVHGVTTTAPRCVLVAPELADTLTAVRDRLPAGVKIWSTGPSCAYPDVAGPADTAANSEPDPGLRSPDSADPALLIFTSGTTGLPKAAVVSHRRVLEWSYWFAGMLDVRPADRMYNCLPMYHSVGGVSATGAMLVNGASVFISPRFSVSRLWNEIADGECTIFQYVGELCRYLLRSPPHPRENDHHLRLCCGNGLRADVWQPFKQRFRVPHVLEFYAATESNVSLYNCEEQVGAIGRVPAFLAHRFPIALVRVDPETGEPRRSLDGYCLRCEPNEPGEAIGKLPEHPGSHGRPFEGYVDQAASAGKVLRHVFTGNDAWYRTGDLLRMDELGFFYFVDRLGDTFRWKGENVATDEVVAVVRHYPGVTEAVVYGVEVPGSEGRAGMAAMAVDDNFDFPGFYRYLAERLPEYARPLFLRICKHIPVTDTFKSLTSLLRREGFDPKDIRDPLYVADRDARAFTPLTADLYADIRHGRTRL